MDLRKIKNSLKSNKFIGGYQLLKQAKIKKNDRLFKESSNELKNLKIYMPAKDASSSATAQV